MCSILYKPLHHYWLYDLPNTTLPGMTFARRLASDTKYRVEPIIVFLKHEYRSSFCKCRTSSLKVTGHHSAILLCHIDLSHGDEDMILCLSTVCAFWLRWNELLIEMDWEVATDRRSRGDFEAEKP